MFGGGIMGKMMERTVGRAVENLAQNAAEQLRAAQQQAEQLQESATQALESSEQLKQYMGGQVRIAEPISDSVSMQSVNGQRKQMVSPDSLEAAALKQITAKRALALSVT